MAKVHSEMGNQLGVCRSRCRYLENISRQAKLLVQAKNHIQYRCYHADSRPGPQHFRWCHLDVPRLMVYSRLTTPQEAFKEPARVLRWRVLAANSYDERQQDLILGMENLINVCKLGWESSPKSKMWIACLLWVSWPMNLK